METPFNLNEAKLKTIHQNAPIGLLEAKPEGTLVEANRYARTVLDTLQTAFQSQTDNLFELLANIGFTQVTPASAGQAPPGLLLPNQLLPFQLPGAGPDNQRYYLINVTKFAADCLIFALEDVTSRQLEDQQRQEAELGRAIAQSKFESASGVLHDIGNAVVGFGSYLTRIRRAQEANKLDSLNQLALFVEREQAALSQALGTQKADALLTMVQGLTQAHQTTKQELQHSITEQLNIITHIQDILTIQRHYVAGQQTQERKAVNLRSLLNDCLAILSASLDKRAISVSLALPTELPSLKGDRTKLMQVFLNLLKNSLEAIDPSAVNKSIVIQAHAQAHQLTITIQDSGQGFDQATGQQLFTRSFTTKSTGTGLGLYNCQSILESHAGSLTLTSPGAGQGALVTIQFVIDA